ncbi:MAG: PAS domain S-box protein [Syntrophobacteraceae bacterium]
MTQKPSYEELERRVQELEKEMLIRMRAGEALRESEKRYRSLVETGGVPGPEGEFMGYRGMDRDITGRKRAEEALRESEEKYRSIFEHSQEAILLTVPDGSILDANQAACRMFGRSLDEIKNAGRNGLADMTDPRLHTALSERARTGVASGEITMLRANGDKFPVEITSTVFVDARGRQKTSMIIRDISERKRSEEALKERDIQFKKLFLHVPGMIYQFMKRPDGTYCVPFTTEAIEDIFGCSSQDVRVDFSPIAGVLLPEDLDRLIDSIESSAERMTTWQCEYRVKVPGRPIRWMFGQSTPEKLADGSIIWHGFNTDITERKRAEEELKAIKAQLSNALEMAHLGHWEYDVANDLFTFNDQFYKLFRTTVEQAGGYKMHSAEYSHRFVHPDDISVVREETRKAIETTDPLFNRTIEHRMLYSDGAVGYISVRFFIVKDSHGRTVKTYGVNQVITELKHAEENRRSLEERLQRAEKMEALGTLAGGVAHDLNNVLGIVVGYSELLLDDLDESGSATARSQAMEILKGGQRAAAIVQDLLTLARRGVPSRKVLNLNNIIMECQKNPEFSAMLSYRPNIKIKTDFEVDLLNLSGSSVHLSKSVYNLVSNAAEAMPNGGDITIKTRNHYLDKPVWGYDEVKEGDYVVLSISDTGEGIPASDLKRIFEPFYTKKVMGRSGTGLGLAVVWGTVKDHLGYINVESEQGRGTTVTLYFPVTRDEIFAEQVSIFAAEYRGKGESILIVDDVKEQRELSGTMLEKLNYAVVSVSSGEEAVEYLKQNTVDLVVLDMIMDPGMDGLDTYAKILEIHPHQRAIIVSGFSETERVSKAQALGAGTYVKKPYVLEKLGLAARKELDQPALPAPPQT